MVFEYVALKETWEESWDLQFIPEKSSWIHEDDYMPWREVGASCQYILGGTKKGYDTKFLGV